MDRYYKVSASRGKKEALDSGSDGSLISRVRAGDSRAMRELFDLYFDRLYALVFHAVGKNQAAAEDVVQETFLSAIKSASRFKGESHIYTWLVGISQHKVADHYRKLKRERKNIYRSIDVFPGGQMETADSGLSPADLLEFTEEKVMVEQALQQLPVDYRQVLLLKYMEDMPVLDISRALGRSPKSIEGLLARARKALRENLDYRNEG